MQNLQEEIEFFRKKYRRQKALEKIVNKRELKRPKTKKMAGRFITVFCPRNDSGSGPFISISENFSFYENYGITPFDSFYNRNIFKVLSYSGG